MSPVLKADVIAKHVAAELIMSEQGATISVDTTLPIASSTGYLVAYGRDIEWIYELDDGLLPDLDTLTEWVAQFIAIVPTHILLGRNVGGWVHDGNLYLDVTEWVSSREEAIQLGRSRSQISVWDVVRADAIFIHP